MSIDSKSRQLSPGGHSISTDCDYAYRQQGAHHDEHTRQLHIARGRISGRTAHNYRRLSSDRSNKRQHYQKNG